MMDALVPFLILAVSFAGLMGFASLFVDGAVGLANAFGIPKLIVGIVLVSMATTAPEFTVSVIAAFQGEPEIALGNAVGSVICDDGLALGLAGLLTVAPIAIQPALIRTTGLFILGVALLVFGLAANGTIGRVEGICLLLLLAAYFGYVIVDTKKTRRREARAEKTGNEKKGRGPTLKLWARFLIGVTGVVVASKFVVDSSIDLAQILGVPEVIVGLIGVAFGTSLPEVVTCVVSARKGQGELAVGNILGADILNVLWIIGMSSVVNPIRVEASQIYFMFPAMIVIVGAMLVLLRIGLSLNRWKGLVLVTLYGVYLFLALFFFMGP